MMLKNKQIHVLIITTLILMVVILWYSAGSEFLQRVRAHSYSYGYSLPRNMSVEDTSDIPSAEAVPILMYHGISDNGVLGDNTERKVFISQMEMLKQKGYNTISIREYDLFRGGEFVLPPKPVIITFDDGRKDSFYPTDEVLKKLGYKATIFVATIRANENDPFYLNWSELKEVQDTGRWEIEAHGRRSHELIPTNEKGLLGSYLTSRMYLPNKGLESVEDYKKRVETDYINGILDLKEHLGIDAHYFAVPLNSYGVNNNPDYYDAYKFNQELSLRFFKLAFVQAQQNDGNPLESFYNYKDSIPFISLMRLEVKNISSEDLLKSLKRFAPSSPHFVFPRLEGVDNTTQNMHLLYGSFSTSNGITLISSTSTPSARMLLGDKGWTNYSTRATVVREKGRSMSIIICYLDADNYISLNWGEKSIMLIELVGGEKKILASYYPWEKEGETEILLSVKDGYITAGLDGLNIAQSLPVRLTRGAIGFSVWDPVGAQSTIKNIEITSLK